MGIVVDIVQRPKRLKATAVGKFNGRFLEENGFRETDGDDISHYDDSGKALRFLEAQQNRLNFHGCWPAQETGVY
ncbi:hypothetical protein X744_19200 [Mesorhizobium sp. LNJC372A00]|nr:hypothetical protein X745_11995 [Mesorhizobium sp. LNJC374B00]ESY57235.1 hypothetical protein X744_19200 [Mesorhizobium sp. LNJC372A00]